MKIAPIALLTLLLLACDAGPASGTPVVGLPCEDCDAALDGMPARPPHRAPLAPPQEPGARLLLEGRVVDAAGRPVAGVVLYAHQTDATGVYPRAIATRDGPARRHGRLRAWVTTDADGRYAFDTIRPGRYPGRDLPAHIHLHVIERGCALYYIDDVMFRDDPALTPDAIRTLASGRGGSGIVTPRRTGTTWHARRDIILGRAIPGYPSCRH